MTAVILFFSDPRALAKSVGSGWFGPPKGTHLPGSGHIQNLEEARRYLGQRRKLLACMSSNPLGAMTAPSTKAKAPILRLRLSGSDCLGTKLSERKLWLVGRCFLLRFPGA